MILTVIESYFFPSIKDCKTCFLSDCENQGVLDEHTKIDGIFDFEFSILKSSNRGKPTFSHFPKFSTTQENEPEMLQYGRMFKDRVKNSRCYTVGRTHEFRNSKIPSDKIKAKFLLTQFNMAEQDRRYVSELLLRSNQSVE